MRVLLLLFFTLCAMTSHAHEDVQASLRVLHPWARATVPGAQTGGVYLQIQNTGEADRLISAKADLAQTTELHAMSMQGNTMQMRKLDDGVKLPTKQTVDFSPGGMHIMLVGLKAPLKEGSMFPLKLRFEKAGEKLVEVKVEPLTYTGQSAHQ